MFPPCPAVRPAVLLLLALMLAGAPVPPAAAQAAGGPEVARRWREAREAEILREFAELLALPNVASDRENVRRNAEWIVSRLREAGVDAEALTLPGANPIVVGELRVPGATRTLGVYVHYDGQPADPANWTHAPWEPTLYSRSMEAGGEPIPLPAPGDDVDPEWRLYARSAGDDKAPIGALLPVLRSFREAGVRPTSNVVFLFEGEEEAGSDHLGAYLEAYRDRFAPVDLWLFFDGPVHASGRPQLTFGVRGVTGLSLTVYGATRSLHSGHYGNWAPVPGQHLAELLASMKDAETGRVLVEGFYDSVEPIGEAERRALDALPDYDRELMEELGLAAVEGEGASLEERLLLPSLTVRGLASGNVGALARNVIPSTAEAVLGVRLVKGNDPEHMLDLVEAHIRRQGWHLVREEPDAETRLRHPKIVRVERGGGYPAARTAMDLPVVRQVTRAAEAAAASADLGPLVLLPGLGGSLPLYLFGDVLGTPAVIVPVANHDNNQHAPDENLRVANLWYAIDLYASLLTMPPGAVPEE